MEHHNINLNLNETIIQVVCLMVYFVSYLSSLHHDNDEHAFVKLTLLSRLYPDIDDVILDELSSPATKFDEISLTKEVDEKEKPESETEHVM